MQCAPDAQAILDTSSPGDRRTAEYWALRVRLGLIDGRPTLDERRIYKIMTGGATLSIADYPALNPLHENDGLFSSADQWGYGRQPIPWPEFENLPSPWSGFARWHTDPQNAAPEPRLGRLASAL